MKRSWNDLKSREEREHLRIVAQDAVQKPHSVEELHFEMVAEQQLTLALRYLLEVDSYRANERSSEPELHLQLNREHTV